MFQKELINTFMMISRRKPLVAMFFYKLIPRFLRVKALKYLYLNHGDQQFFFQFEIIINVLVMSFRFV